MSTPGDDPANAVQPAYQTAAGARAAASLLLLRDGAEGLEVLMMVRPEREGDQRGGAAVFPGGVLDARDRAAHAHCLGRDDAQASRQLGLAEGGLDYLVAAVRETFEEVGLLLAQPLGGATLDLAALRPWRARLQADLGPTWCAWIGCSPADWASRWRRASTSTRAAVAPWHCTSRQQQGARPCCAWWQTPMC